MRPIITICVRAGSKGLPNKHLLLFNHRQLIRWTTDIAVAFSGGCIPIYLASDSDEIKTFAENTEGINFIERDPQYATDEAGKVEALRGILKRIEKKGDKFDYVIDLDATNPCRMLKDIYNCVGIFEEKRPKTLFSVVKAKKNPYFNQIFYEKGKVATPVATIANILRSWLEKETKKKGFILKILFEPLNFMCRQLCPKVYDINSNIYIYDTKWLRDENNKSVITDNSEIYIMPDWTYCDIDNEVDFKVAEFLHGEYILNE